MIEASFVDVVRSIHSSGRQLVLAVTGGGSRAVAVLLETPGASRTVLDATVPYSHAALVDWLGGAPERSCSAETAQAMAMAAFVRARRLAPEADPHRLLGTGCTASLASDRPKRGDHRVHVAVQTADEAWSYTLVLTKGRRERSEEEQAAAAMVIYSIAAACGVATHGVDDWLAVANSSERIQSEHERAPPAVVALLLGRQRCAVLKANSTNEYYVPDEAPRLTAVFPGSFNPLHRGHLAMTVEAERRLGQPVAWELSMANVDKPPLDFISVRVRLAGLRSEDDKRVAALTWAPTFREKAELFPGATFVVGADTILRIGDERYYGGDARRRDEALADMARHGCRFLVFGRKVDGRFVGLSDLCVPPALQVLCDEVAAADFRADVSSTELRDGA